MTLSEFAVATRIATAAAADQRLSELTGVP
jgi:hypothetical protein